MDNFVTPGDFVNNEDALIYCLKIALTRTNERETSKAMDYANIFVERIGDEEVIQLCVDTAHREVNDL